MGRLDLLDPRRDEDAQAGACTECRRWNRGTTETFGRQVCGRASCLTAAKARADLAAVLITDDTALD